MLRLGRVNVKVAEKWKDKVEAIVGDKLAQRPHDADLSKWLGELDESMLKRLRAVGLADGVGLSQTTLGVFLERFAANMTTKQSTRTFYSHTRRNLKEHFSDGRLVRDIHAGDADGWRTWMVEHEKLSPATVARRVIAARSIWKMAIRWKLASENPFCGVKAGHQENESRKVFIPHDLIDKAIEAAPDTEWKLIISLARYGGLRIPSELFALRWGDVDWGRSCLVVHSSKTEHHEGRGVRNVPIFPQLRALLMAAFEQAEPGSEYVNTKHRLGALNLRQQFERIIERAGLTLWPRLFQNLRASRETELMREYDLATVCKWIGNSPAIAAKHYAMCVDLDADFKRASKWEEGAVEAQQNAQQSAASSDGPGMTSDEATNEKTLEKEGFVEPSRALAIAGETGAWAIRDSNP